ncbi:unnamed protein product [Allacma fusca]|uniref:C2H2-type domain-containing protein n=1 Tax=Allacma fusca TaxID=39272 RepID=A0A8J2LRD9_9HEXA|nr:unnamed protein product [Allacma fusca]
MTADEHAPKRRGNKNAQRRVSGKKKKKSRTGNGEIIDRKWDQNKNKNQFRQPGRSPGGNTRSPEMGCSQQTNNSDQFHNNGNNGNHELVREVNQLQGSVQLLHQQFQQLGLNHQLIMGKYDAEISKLTLEIQTLRDKMGRNSRKMKNLRAKLSSIETMEVQLQRAAQLQREPAIKLKKKKNPVAESKRKKTRAKIPDTPTQCPVCMKTFKLKRNFSKHQNKTKHGLEGSSISDNLSASPEKTGQSNVSREQKDSPNAVFAEVSPAQTSSNSHENVDPQEVEIVASCHYRPLNNDVSNPVILNETINSTSPAAKSVIFPEKLSESFQNMSPNKRKRVPALTTRIYSLNTSKVVARKTCAVSSARRGLSE